MSDLSDLSESRQNKPGYRVWMEGEYKVLKKGEVKILKKKWRTK